MDASVRPYTVVSGRLVEGSAAALYSTRSGRHVPLGHGARPGQPTLDPPELKHRFLLTSGLNRENMKIYVGNLSFDTTETKLRELFEQHGQVTSASLVMDRDTGRPRGFGFVEMADAAQAQAAIGALNGSPLDGRSLNVNEARPKPAGGGGGGRGRW
jgi:cold-inducible RNA-binding protein